MSGLEPTLPAYGVGSLADVLPSVAGALSVPGESNVLDLPEAPRYAVLLLDGLGWNLLRRRADLAPYLSSLAGRVLTAGVPSTTAASLTSLGTGLPPGAHGIVGYTSMVPETGALLNALAWDAKVDPRRWQPHRTVFERVAAAGVATRNVSKARFDTSGLTAAAFRGSAHRGADTIEDRLDATRFASREGSSSLVYVYDSQLDYIGHGHGCESVHWGKELAAADSFAQRVRSALPRDAVLLVVADHGMVDIAPEHRIDLDAEPALTKGLRLVGGESRFRHLYCVDGAVDDVVATYRERLGDLALVLTREEAAGRGWFGPVEERVSARIGDVVVAALGPVALVAGRRFPQEAALIGLHGSLTEDEMAIPLLVDAG
ncbi:putative AlkP superfamily pyrophosphatase or phosphodiesterase [Kribbella amoyensis]|uniref:Putative AlkP superfamily pyrophosphatase or phosphodiesterase n=1 Tax=Kribbella amoyensis TaxID=996641 RepID=A0A561BZ44_9ACTN|nr:nucleotide pyrophosphatase/phosphodiesterase family protein [Kribbella amoyensis]TWD84131.1 putative AlkP superfamily pyrophosphatase or phosphodiesterase [Kribbella amoyensis]